MIKKKKYTAPSIEFVSLVLEEVVLTACKNNDGVAGPGGSENIDCALAVCPTVGS
jgi:hypothetical protein